MEGQMFSSSLGAMGSLLGKLRSLLVSPENQLPEPLKLQKHKVLLLKRDLEGINALLVNLAWVEAPNTMVKHWMNEVRDLSYDIEDYIDKTMQANHNKTREEARFDEVEEFSSLVKQANERHNRYDLGRWASNPRILVDVHGQVPRLNKEATYLVGIGDSKAKLTKWLSIDAEHRLVVSIQGPVGVGKTTLAKEVFHEIEAQFECRAFVRASKTPDTRRLLYSIISQVQCHYQRPTYGLPVQELIDILRELVQHKRYFIVIDGLWETASWDIVNNAFPEGNQCSRILITTDIEEVALECCDYEPGAIYKMEPLSGNHSTELFFNRVFGFKHEHSEQLRENTEEIIRACHGLPLAIISTASIFAGQPNNSELWRHVKEALFSRSRYNLTSEGMLREIIVLSYSRLPHHLKTCLMYVSMYPEGYTFLKADLVKQWSAEGFIIALEEKNFDEVAECYFDELVCKGLIQPNDIDISADVILYTVHSAVFEVIRNMCIEENFTTVIDYSNTPSELSAKVRRLSFRFSTAKYATKPENITLSPVRSLIFYGLVDCLPSVMEFEVLRVLILELWGDQKELDLSGINRLFQLSYVRITTNITVKLPARMIGLTYLQTMEIYGRVTSVPSDIIRLPRLLHLCLDGEINLSNGIGNMRSLRTLQSFDLSSNSEDNVRQLGEMKELHHLYVTSSAEMSDHTKRNLIALISSLERLGNLKSIVLAPASSCPSIYLDCSCSISSLSVFLQRLELLPPICIFTRLPIWIGQLQKLSILKIVLRELTKGDVDSIAKLHELTILSLYVKQPTAELIVFHREAFAVLKCFEFRCGVTRLAFQTDSMPSLRRLKLEFNAHSGEQNCNMLVGIEHLLNLQEIAGRIGAAPGAEELDIMTAESMFKDAISKHSRLKIFNLQIVPLFDEEISIFAKTPTRCSSSEEKPNRHSMGDSIRELNEAAVVGEESPFKNASPKRILNDGYKWYNGGQKQVKRSENTHSDYMCAFWNCPARKTVVSRSLDGQITGIVYRGSHNHAKPQGMTTDAMPTNSASSGSIDTDVSSSNTGNSSSDSEMDEQEVDSNSWRKDCDSDGEGNSNRTISKEPRRLVTRTKRDVNISDDDYRWRKYGQKALKGNPNPRIYYKCARVGCPVRKLVERAVHDTNVVVITYEGDHIHDSVEDPRDQAMAYRRSCAEQQQYAHQGGSSAVWVPGRVIYVPSSAFPVEAAKQEPGNSSAAFGKTKETRVAVGPETPAPTSLARLSPPSGLRTGPWSPEEDDILFNYIKVHGHGSWRKLPKLAGLNRSGKGCRLRWVNYLRRPQKKRKLGTAEEHNSDSSGSFSS